MENSVGNSSGVKIPRKSRSLDLQSLYKSGASKEGRTKSKISEENHCEDVSKKKKKSKGRKEVPLSHFEPPAKKIRKENVNEVTSEGELKEKSNGGGIGFNGISLALGEKANGFKIPKRPRGSVGRKKFDSKRDSKQLGFSNAVDRVEKFNAEISKYKDDDAPRDESAKAVDISAGKVGSSKVKRKQLGFSNADRVEKFNTEISKHKDDECPRGEIVKAVEISAQKVGSSKVRQKQLGFSNTVDQGKKFNAEISKRKDDECLRGEIAEAVDISARKVGSSKVKQKQLGFPNAEISKHKDDEGPRAEIAKAVDISGEKVGSSKVKRKQAGFSNVVNQVEKSNADINKCKGGGGPCVEVSKVADVTAGRVGSSKVKRKKLGSSNAVNRVEKFNAEINKSKDDDGSRDETGKVVDLSDGKVGSSKAKRKVGTDEVKEKKIKVARIAKEEDCHVGVDNGGSSSEKQLSNIRKGKHLAAGGASSETASKKTVPLFGNLVSSNHLMDFQNDDDDDDDEENLERNAARMLSSRFDPSCTGFSSKSKSDVSRCANGFSYLVSSARDMVSREANSSAGVESASAHTDIRTLRPRKDDKGMRISRKRRHFYEIRPADLDAYWVLDRKIKVFWPLDETWYYGLVKKYDSESQLHFIEYDDKDEEWVDLQTEKFKLLLLPSEVPNNARRRRRPRVDNHVHNDKAGMPGDDDNSIGTCLDSEPIISWLARSSRRVKPSPNPLKKQKIMQADFSVVSRPWRDKTDKKNRDVDSSESERSRLNFGCALPNDSDGSQRVTKTCVGTRSSFVYMRKRFRNKVFSVSRHGKAHESSTGKGEGTVPAAVMNSTQTTEGYRRTSGCVDIDELSWIIDYDGDLRLNTSLVSSKRWRLELCLPFLPFLDYSLGKVDFWLSHMAILLQHGAIVTVSPTVTMEILFVDSAVGLSLLLFAGCLKQAVALIFIILTVFGQPTEQKNVDMPLPETSVRFGLSFSQDPKDQHLFSFYSFSKMKNSKWLCLESELLKHCVLVKQLVVSECTFDNIKKLEHQSFSVQGRSVGFKLLSLEGLMRKVPTGVPGESCKMGMRHAAFNLASKFAELPRFACSFTAAPAFFTTLHLKLLLDRSGVFNNLQDQDTLHTLRNSEISCQPTADDCAIIESYSVEVQDEVAEHDNIGTLLTRAPGSEFLSRSEQELGKEKLDRSGTTGSKDFKKNAPEFIVQALERDSNGQMNEQSVVIAPKSITSPRSNHKSVNVLSGISVEVPSVNQVDTPFGRSECISRQISDVGWNMCDGPVLSSNPTAPRSSCNRGRSSSGTAPSEDLSPVWHNGKGNFMGNGFTNGPKKPRTQVQYTLPFGGYDINVKQKTHNQKVLPCKRIRRANEKRVSDGSRSSQRNLESLACCANILVTLVDKGWRECGAQIFLELSDHNEWRLAIKLSGVTKYSFKVQHVLQPGSTNRYTHAMMWKGGKDWVLEFPDRSQWMLFKEMHEECYNRNIRAASVKNIPIPGVRLIEESYSYGTQVPFLRNPVKYFQQVQSDVEMAMDPSRILYDMDSDDEKWLTEDKKCGEISDELFEKTMDMLEKVSYVQRRNHFSDDELEEMMAGTESKETAKVIYEHWRQKRERTGMPLIRQLQPPLWERYEQQLREWERAVARRNTAISTGFQENSPLREKPPMFAFCLKPRGLDFPHRGSKQRAHRKFPSSGYNHTASGDHYGLHSSGRRLSGIPYGDQKGLFPVNVYESVDASPILQASTRVLSPRDSIGLGSFSLNNHASEWTHLAKMYNNKPKKLGSYSSHRNQRTMASFNKRTSKIKGIPLRKKSLKPYYNDGAPRLGVDHFGCSDEEMRLRDATVAAKHARQKAKLKREKAQRLFYRADLAIHKAVAALMTADAMKAAYNSYGCY